MGAMRLGVVVEGSGQRGVGVVADDEETEMDGVEELFGEFVVVGRGTELTELNYSSYCVAYLGNLLKACIIISPPHPPRKTPVPLNNLR